MDCFIEDNILKSNTQTIEERTLSHVIFDALNESPDHISQIDAETGKQTTCQEMKDRSIRCALWMKDRGIEPDDIVVVCTHNHLDSYIPVFATFFVDAIFSAWSEDIAPRTVRRFMKQFTPKFIFANEKAATILVEAAKLENSNVEFIIFGKYLDFPSLTVIIESPTIEKINNFALSNKKSPQDVAVILLSSGSTGFPKGVMLSSIAMLKGWGQQNMISNEIPKFLWYSRLEWTSCLNFILQTIRQKITRIIPTSSDPENFCQIIQKYKVDYAFIPPILIHYLAKFDWVHKYDMRSLKTILTTGSRVNKTTLETLNNKIPTVFIENVYGATEIGGFSRTTRRSKNIESVGFIYSNCQAKIVDPTSGKTLGSNERGELCAKTPSMMIGYYKNPKETIEAIEREGWYHTGDLAYYDDSGQLFIVDRIKETMICKHHLVSPAEIEELLLSHPDVQEVAVVPIQHDRDDDYPVAFVKKVPGSNVTERELAKLTLALEDYKRLRGGIHFLDDLPHTASGKIARYELKQLAKEITQITSKSQ